VVTYNGKSFDIPLLNARHTLSAFRSPFPAMQHVDLLALSRRIWRNRLPSRSLGSIEHDVLAINRTEEEIPGWMIPEMYFDYLKTGDSRPMAGVFYHNRMDILSLAALFLHQSNLLSNPMDWLAAEGLDLIAIARLYDDTGRREQAIQLYEHSLSLGLPRPFFIQTLYRYADLARKEARFDQALGLWHKAAEMDEIPACLELAKHYEHRERDFDTALKWTEQAFRLLDQSIQPLYLKKITLAELKKRQDRLYRKLQSRRAQSNPDEHEEESDEQS
jgi:tetratricopeptide (TPR) repeat protein